ncbi:SATB2 [Mytilus coruscus]|uniref:SATB2 n=1 Tax=Mytilus coruscus TaxID=42192 RepID=A0A6J8E8B0_MYTCO|nr:SATB2 [Mytilus coruscus]
MPGGRGCLPGITSPDTWNDHTVRCAVLSLLKEMGQTALAKLCPLTQSAISNIANWKYNNKLSDEKCAEFGKWYTQYMSNTTGKYNFPCDFGIAPKDSRLTFHPDHEIPEMRQWYKTCKNPTEHKLNFFANELNKGHVRQERPKVTVAKLKIWWKNERQREKKMKKSVKTATVTSLPNVKTVHKSNAMIPDSIDIVQQSLDLASEGSETFQKSHDQFEEPVELLEQLHESNNVTKGAYQTERKSYVTLQPTSENSLNINPIISTVSGMSEMNYNQNRRMENISESSLIMNRYHHT